MLSGNCYTRDVNLNTFVKSARGFETVQKHHIRTEDPTVISLLITAIAKESLKLFGSLAH